ncbi:MAG: glycosyltransferase [Bacteroidia bacterium]|nr:glycosyltransferase [Bacteroidia bacterium]
MQIFGHYLEKHALYSSFIKDNPNDDLFLSIVIPCFNEPDIIASIDSLWECTRPDCSVEVIIVINASEDCNEINLNQNKISEKIFDEWQKSHSENKFRFYKIVVNDLPQKDAGVGLARKIGMDEAVRRFNLINKKDGVLIGFDADCKCMKNYLCEIENIFKQDSKLNGCSIQFEHPFEGDEFDDFTYNAIASYELYLRYYIEALKLAGHPFAFQTIGSSFAVRAEAYCKQGGMNKRKAGEDFYFLQKIIQLGNYAELNTTKVFPSPRSSDRVPFGTGAAIGKMQISGDSNYMTYDLTAFEDIADIVEKSCTLFGANEEKIKSVIKEFSVPMQNFLNENNFIQNVGEINLNSNSQLTFSQRFFRWFDMFKVLKYMNYSHQGYYNPKPISEVAINLLENCNCITSCRNSKELCEIYREINLNY